MLANDAHLLARSEIIMAISTSGTSSPLVRSSTDTITKEEQQVTRPLLSHPNCQIIYVFGAEGSMHHGAAKSSDSEASSSATPVRDAL